MGILKFLRRHRYRKYFQGYLNPEAIEKLLGEPNHGISPPEVKHFQFVVILVDDKNPQDVPAIIRTAVDTLVRQRANVSTITPSLLVGLLGTPFPEGNSPQARRELVDALLQNDGQRIRIAHGECDGAVGIFGGHDRWAFGAAIPGFSGILSKLLETDVGTAIEIP